MSHYAPTGWADGRHTGCFGLCDKRAVIAGLIDKLELTVSRSDKPHVIWAGVLDHRPMPTMRAGPFDQVAPGAPEGWQRSVLPRVSNLTLERRVSCQVIRGGQGNENRGLLPRRGRRDGRGALPLPGRRGNKRAQGRYQACRDD